MKSIKKLIVRSGIIGLIGIGSYIYIQRENNLGQVEGSLISSVPSSVPTVEAEVNDIVTVNVLEKELDEKISVTASPEISIVQNTTFPFSTLSPTQTIVEEVDNRELVALTFDDGPSQYTDELLGLLEKYDIKATFFVLEYNCKKFPEMVQKMAENGHEVAIHGSTHTAFTNLTIEEIYNEINFTANYIKSLEVDVSELVRPPYGSLNSTIKENVDYPFILWNIDTEDWKTRDKELIKQEITDNISNGCIILMHDTNKVYECDYQALDEILPTLIENYHFVTVSELFESNNLELENGKTYRKVKSEN